MMEPLGLAAGLALPWLAGFAVVRALLARFGSRDLWIEVGYGHFAGILLVTLLLRALARIGLGLAFAPTAIALAAIAIAALLLARRQPRVTAGAHIAPAPEVPRVLRWLAIVAVALVVVRAGTLAVEVAVRPLFAWDAWSQWGTKAKVWSALREMVPFVDYATWLARSGSGYTDTAPHYPATVPLLQTWMTLALGRWDDALMNLPWLTGFVALGLAVFGQLRRLGTGTTWAALASYLVVSLPFLNVHVALAGYADFHVAAAYALALLALAEWEATRARGSLVLLAASATMLPLLKVPGIAWLGTVVLGVVVATFGTTRLRIVVGFVVVLLLTTSVALLVGTARIAVQPATDQQRIAESLVQHLFAFGSWNLLWYLVPLAIVVAWQDVLARKAVALALLCGFGFLAWTFFFTRTGDWVVDYTTVNRALLHIAPAAAAFAALCVARIGTVNGDRPRFTPGKA